MNTNEQNEKMNFKTVFKKYFNKKEALLLPNILCYFRILLVVAFLVVYLVDFTVAGNPNANVYFATAIMVIASYTDFVDGYIARTFNMKSNLGKVLDPIADKLLQLAIAVALVVRFYNFASLDLMLAIFVCKEGTLMLQDVYLAKKKRSFDGAKWYGKVASFLFYVICGVILFFGPIIVRTYPLDTANGHYYAHVIIDSLCSVVIFFLLIAWLFYSIFVIKLARKKDVVETSETKEDEGK